MFSYKCKVCDESIKSGNGCGERCHLFLLVDGKVVETMSGQYDNEGSVFNEELDGSFDWDFDSWNKLVGLHFNDNGSNGFAAYHERCYQNHIPNDRSENDPFRGAGTFRITNDNSSTHALLIQKDEIQINDGTLKEFFDNQKGLIKKLLKD